MKTDDYFVRWISFIKESIAFFSWKNFKLFLLVGLNTFVRSLVFLGKYFWWLVAFILMFDFAALNLLKDLCILLLSFFALLTVRSSIEMKEQSYYANYMQYFPLYAFVILGIISLVFVPVKLLLSFAGICLKKFCLVQSGPFSFAFLAGLFLLDYENTLLSSFNAFVSAVRVVVYFLPVMALFFSIELVATYFLNNGMAGVAGLNYSVAVSVLLRVILWIVKHTLVVLMLSYLSAFYVRVKHKHHRLFFMP